jgi:peptidoglycan/xylan/chitin deacetylase (PgdA/CDA1 family)
LIAKTFSGLRPALINAKRIHQADLNREENFMNMKAKNIIYLLMSVICFLFLAALPACQNSLIESPDQKTASVSVSVMLQQDNIQQTAARQADVVFGTASDVASITLDVFRGSTAIITGQNLSNCNSVWSGTLTNMPLGEVLTFIGHAYNSSPLEIFIGTASQVLTGTNDTVTFTISPINNGIISSIPRITKIVLPNQIIVSGTVAGSVSVEAKSGASITYSITAEPGGGTFDPQTGVVTLIGTAGIFPVTYKAPSIAGTYTHIITVANNQGNWVKTPFTTNIVNALSNQSMDIIFSPVITDIGGQRSGALVTFTATVNDDGPQSGLTYQWGFDKSLAFVDSTTNPAVLQGFNETMSGNLTLTVSNASGDSSTVSYYLAPGLFPDTVIAQPPAAPGSLQATAGFSQATLTWTAVTDALSYNLYWSTTPWVSKTTGTQIPNVTSPYVHTGLAGNTTYYYIVTAQNQGGESTACNEAAVSIPPAAPGAVTATGGNGKNTIAWDTVEGATSYNIYWSITSGVAKTTGTKITYVSSPYTQTGITNGTTYYYVVTAVSPFGESIESQQATSTYIYIADWLKGAAGALSLTFDDIMNSHSTIIGPLLEKYNLRGTFFVIAGGSDYNSLRLGYKQLSDKGHEIGNHSYHHVYLTTLSTGTLRQEINAPITILENDMGKRPVSFCQPYNSTNATVETEIFKTHLFSRISSPYDLKNRFYDKGLNSLSTFNDLSASVDSAINEKKWLIFNGHGADGNGYMPISSGLLDSILNYITSKGDKLWVDTLGHIGQYDYLRREITLHADRSGDTLFITLRGYDPLKYRYMDSSPITIAIKNEKHLTLSSPDHSIIMTTNNNIVYVTFDLKLTSVISLKIAP